MSQLNLKITNEPQYTKLNSRNQNRPKKLNQNPLQPNMNQSKQTTETQNPIAAIALRTANEAKRATVAKIENKSE